MGTSLIWWLEQQEQMAMVLTKTAVLLCLFTVVFSTSSASGDEEINLIESERSSPEDGQNETEGLDLNLLSRDARESKRRRPTKAKKNKKKSSKNNARKNKRRNSKPKKQNGNK